MMKTLEGFPSPALGSPEQSPFEPTRSMMGTLEGFPNPPAMSSHEQSSFEPARYMTRGRP